MKFKLPKDLTVLSAEDLAELLDAAIAEYTGIAETPEDDLSDEQIADIEALSEAVDAINAESTGRETAATERAERLAAAKGKMAAATASTEGDEDGEGSDEDAEGGEDGEEDDEGAEGEDSEKVLEAVAASAKPRQSSVARAARRTPTAPAPKQELPKPATLSLTAAANVPEFNSGAELADFADVAKAFASRSKSFSSQGSSGRGGRRVFERFGVAKMRLPENEFTLGMGTPLEEQLRILDAAGNQSRLPKGSLTAAGGWCAPSETIYDGFLAIETVSGILSIPEVQINRGGINFTKGPDYATLAADWGFLQTETQAEAGTTKVCYDVDCPDFDEVRLDAIGFCIKAGILTNVGYPELIKRVLQIGAVAHAHKVNYQVISRIATALGTAINYTENGSGTDDLLNGLELNAEVLRYRYSLAIGATIEVVLPAWARLIARQDLALREGVDFQNITDALLTQWFSTRGLAVQFVYDYQPLDTVAATAGKALPVSVEALMYPAGAFIKGVANVIDLDTVYDSTGLSTNTYTAAFFEQGLLVANRGAGGIKVQIALSYKGASGYPSIGAVAGVAFAPPAA